VEVEFNSISTCQSYVHW